MLYMDALHYVDRRKRLADVMCAHSVLLLFSGTAARRSADSFYPYCVNRNFYYMTGIDRANSALLIVKNNSGVEEKLFIVSSQTITNGMEDFPLQEEDAAVISGVKSVCNIADLNGQLHKLLYGNRRDGLRGGKLETVYLDLERQSFDDTPSATAAFANKLREQYPYLQLRDAYHTIANMRRIKSKEEIKEITDAIALTGRGIEEILKVAKPGGNECHLEAVFAATTIAACEKDYGFPPIIACGKNALFGHYAANKRPLVDGELVLLDLGCNSHYYSADVSRVFPVSGKFTPEQCNLYEAVRCAHEKILSLLGPGQYLTQNRDEGTELITQELAHAGYSKQIDSEFWCFGGVDHYLGLDTHDVGYYDIPFEPGMVVTVDSAVRLPKSGISFRLEDDLLITENGCVNLSQHIPTQIAQIEAMMQGKG